LALPGAGAAGGLGAGLAGGLGAKLVAGAGLVMDELGFDRRLAAAGLLVTGEGSLDAQSLRGKAPVAAARRAAEAGVPAVALVGRLKLRSEELAAAGLRRAWEMTELAPPEECLRRAAEILEALALKHAAEMM
jgi:glycerate kinase